MLSISTRFQFKNLSLKLLSILCVSDTNNRNSSRAQCERFHEKCVCTRIDLSAPANGKRPIPKSKERQRTSEHGTIASNTILFISSSLRTASHEMSQSYAAQPCVCVSRFACIAHARTITIRYHLTLRLLDKQE